jgi:hypothetical protein
MGLFIAQSVVVARPLTIPELVANYPFSEIDEHEPALCHGSPPTGSKFRIAQKPVLRDLIISIRP